jgi:hypothetical protein
MFLKKIYRLVMQILINLKIKWSGSDVIVTPIEPEPLPIPIDPVTPPQSSVIDITSLWYDTFKSGSGELILESGKTYSISTVKRQRITGRVRIKTTGAQPAYLWVGKAMYLIYVDSGEDSVLFELANGADVLIDNVWPSLREQDRDVQQMYSVNWFTSVQDPNATWTASVRNCDTTFLGRNGGFGMGVLYGSTGHNYIEFKNYKHAGPMIMELKNPYPNAVMYLVMDNVTTDYVNSSEWSKRAHLTTGKISKSNNVLNLTGDVEVSCLYNHFFLVDKGSNRSFLAHVGRFTFMVDNVDAMIDLKNIQLRPAPKAGEKVLIKRDGQGVVRLFFNGREAHVGDTLKIQGSNFSIREKLKTENDEWTNNFGGGNSPLTIKAPQMFINELTNLPNGEYIIEEYNSSFNLFDVDQPVYLIYKDDLNFRTTMSTKFGDWQVLESRGGWHMAYNHRNISMWVKDVDLNSGIPNGDTDPYYRESTNGSGISLGYNIVNCKGFDDEFSDKLITTDKPIPNRIKNLV